MRGENSEIYLPEMTKITFKFSNIAEENRKQ